jgi:hypothetical protein
MIVLLVIGDTWVYIVGEMLFEFGEYFLSKKKYLLKETT